MTDPSQRPQHARGAPPRTVGLPWRMAIPAGLLITVIGMIWALADMTTVIDNTAAPAPPAPAAVTFLPPVTVDEAEVLPPCETPSVQELLAAGDDNAVVTAFGGGAVFHRAVRSGQAPCINLHDPTRLWLVVNKQRGLSPEAYAPTTLGVPASVNEGPEQVRADVAAALDALSAASVAAGHGRVALASGYRSHQTQVDNFDAHVEAYGVDGAEALSARPGYSEHQTGLAADVVACTPECGGILDFGATATGKWVAANGWKYGFIVRYDHGETGVTGYEAEPWHLRYVGPELAAAYHAGEFRSLEAFFDLPPAPDYAP